MKAIIAVLFLAAAVYAVPQCPSQQETDWSIELLLRHDECDKFWKCTFGQPVEQLCYGGLHFNLETWQCDWPENVDCEGRKVPGEDTEEDSAPEPEPEVELSAEEEEEVVASAEEEEAVPSSEEVETEPEEETQPETEPEPEVEETVEETVEEKAEETVEEEVEEAEKSAEASPDKSPEQSAENSQEEQPENEFLENGCPVDPHVHWLLPHEEDCNKFYYCVWGEKVLRNCAASLHFNRVIQVCDWPADAGCAVSANKHYSARVAYRL